MPYFVAALTLLFATVTTTYVALTAESRDQTEFEKETAEVQKNLSLRLSTFIAMLRAGAGVFAAHPHTGREDFRRFVDAFQLRERYPGIQGIGFARRYAHGDQDEVARDLRDQGASSFRIWPDNAGEGFAIVYLEPLDRRNAAALGYDMFSETTRRAAMERARDTGMPAASGPVALVQEIDPDNKQSGFLVYVPVYRGGVDPGTIEGRRAAIQGFVFAPFRLEDLLVGTFGVRPDPRFSIEIHDGHVAAPGQAMARTRHTPAVPASYEPRFVDTTTLDVAGRPWTVRVATEPLFDRTSRRSLAPFVALAGGAIAVLLFVVTRAESLARASAEQSAADLTAAEAERAAALSREREARAEAERLFEAEAEARRMADVANRTKDEFLATVSHELRTPLTAVMGWVRMLRQGGLDDGGRARALEVVERNVELQARLIEDLLDVSRIITGKLRLDLRPIAIGPVVATAVDVLRPTADARQVHLGLADEAPGAVVVGDPDRLQQVVWNLLSNAVRFTSRGGRVDVFVRRIDGYIEIAVADTGKGIAPEFLPYVFDRFRQAEGSNRRGYGGLGLGLAIVRHFAELHGGAATAESAGEGRGATFRVTLPAREISATDRASSPDATAPRASVDR